MLIVPQRASEDLLPYLPQPYDRNQLFFGDRHPRALTYEAFARNLCERLVAEGLVPATRCTAPE